MKNVWGHFKDGILKACDEVCGKKRRRRSKGDIWWLNEETKEAVSRIMHTRRCVRIVLRQKRGGIIINMSKICCGNAEQ